MFLDVVCSNARFSIVTQIQNKAEDAEYRKEGEEEDAEANGEGEEEEDRTGDVLEVYNANSCVWLPPFTPFFFF